MANRYAVATGNWSNAATWDGGASIPANGDTVRPNGFTVTIDQNIGAVGAVTELRNDAGGGAVASGSFSVTGAYTLYANITGGSTVAVCTFSNSAGVTVTVIGNITGGSGFNGNNVVFSGGGTLNITGKRIVTGLPGWR